MVDTYSVWNWKKGRYDYYRSGTPRPFRARISYPAARGLRGMGEVPEQSVHNLPLDAVFVGEGDEAVGVISSGKQRSGVVFVIVSVALLWLLR